MIVVTAVILIHIITLHSQHYYPQSQCLVSQSKQLANAESAISISMEYNLETLSDVLSIYQILKQIDIQEKVIKNRTFYHVGSALQAEIMLGLQVSPYDTSYSLESGKEL